MSRHRSDSLRVDSTTMTFSQEREAHMVRKVLAPALVAAAFALPASATIIDFTGGTVTNLSAGTAITNNDFDYSDVDYYEEGGFRLDFQPNGGSGGFATHVGNYYGVGNDVIHSHWSSGFFGGVDVVEITKIGGGTFDLNFLTLTSNTEFGGGLASGNELAYVQGWFGGNPTGAPVLLPSQDWGFPAVQVAFGADFNAVDSVTVYVENRVDCFGMDDFAIDEVPAPGAASLLVLGGLIAARRRRN